MNVDELTIGQVKTLQALLGGANVEESRPVFQAMVGKHVVVRSHMSGVWFGVVESAHGEGVTLAPGARRAWSWTQAGSCTGLRLTGPSGGKITPPEVGVVVLGSNAQIVEIGVCTEQAVEAWRKVPGWTGRE